MPGKGDGGSGHPRMSAGYPGSSTGQGEEHKGMSETAQEKASQVGEMAGQVKDKAQEIAGQVRDKAQEAWRSAREGVQQGWSTVSGQAGDIWEDSTEFVRRYPIASVAVAFGLGCLTACAFAALTRLSSDDVANRMSRSSM